MAQTVQCACGKVLEFSKAQQGDIGQCPACGNRFTIGAPISSAAIQDQIDSIPRGKPANTNEDEIDSRRVRNIEKPWRISFLNGCMLLAVGGCIFTIMIGYSWSQLGMVGGGDGQIADARALVRGPLNQACDAYRVQHGHFPKSLDLLLDKDAVGGPYLENPMHLIDPWGVPFRYDPKGPRNNGERPDIWTVTPHEGIEIGNWPRGQ